jgi:predicted ribosomally synthesized peptide with SipW-like signal peptide
MLVASIAVGVTLAYFTADANVAGNVGLGEPVNINITQGGSTVTSLTFSDDALPGHVYDQVIGISVPANTSDALLRAKLTISNADGLTLTVDATTVDSWVEGEDDYYYYNGIARAGDAIDFVTAVTIPTGMTNEYANKTFNINISVEAIQEANNAARDVWTTAPTVWLDTYNPVITEEDDT